MCVEDSYNMVSLSPEAIEPTGLSSWHAACVAEAEENQNTVSVKFAADMGFST
jgi:hypothetical protein